MSAFVVAAAPGVYTHSNVPEELSFNTNKSVLVDETFPPPKSIVPKNPPDIYKFPDESIAIPYPRSAPELLTVGEYTH